MKFNQQPSLDVAKTWSAQPLKHERQLHCCRFSPCGKFVVAGGLENRLLRWNLASGEKTILAGHKNWISQVAFHSDQKRLYTVDFQGTLICWPYGQPNPKPLWTIADTGHRWVRTVCVSLDGKTVATGGNDNLVRLWSADNGKPLRQLAGHQNYVFSSAVHPDGKTLVTGDLLGKVLVWDIASGKLQRTIDASLLHSREDNFLADVGGVRCLAFNKTGTQLACGGMREATSNTFCPGKPTVLVFDWASGKLKQQLEVKQKSDGPINGLCFLPDGTLAGIGEGSGGSSLAFWKPDSAQPVHFLKSTSGYGLDLHPDGLRLAAPLFLANGRGGNGRHAKPEEYTSNDGVVQVYHLYAKPAKSS